MAVESSKSSSEQPHPTPSAPENPLIPTPKSELVPVKGRRLIKTGDGNDPLHGDLLSKLSVTAREGGKKLTAELRGDGVEHTLRVSEEIIPAGAIIPTKRENDTDPANPPEDPIKSWYRVDGEPKPWTAESPSTGDKTLPVDRILSNHPGQEYAIRIEATAIDQAEVEDVVHETRNNWKKAEQNASRDPQFALAKDQLTERYNEVATGDALYNIRFVVGGKDAESGKAIARDVAAGAQSELPYTFSVHDEAFTSADEAIASQTGIIGSPPLLARVLPFTERELPGQPLVEKSPFSSNLLGSDEIPEQNRVVTGTVLDAYGQPGVPFVRDRFSSIEGTLVAGGIRSGKSIYTETALAEEIISGELAGEPIGALILSPKVGHDDYGERFAAKIGEHGREVSYFTIGDPNEVSISINPLEPRPGETIRERQDKVIAFFTNAHAASGEYDPEMGRFFAQYLREAVYGYDRDGKRFPSIYDDAGFDVKFNTSKYPGGDPKWPSVKDLILKGMAAGKVKEYEGEGGKNTPELWGSYMENIVMGAGEDFFTGKGSPIDFDKLRTGITVIKLDKATDPMQRSLITISLLDAMVHEAERVKRELPPGTPNRLRQSIIIEEAQAVLPKDSPAGAQVDQIIQQGASAGIGVTTVFQNPEKASIVATGNAGSIVALKLQDKADIDRMQSLLGINDEQAKEMMKPEKKGRAMYRGTGTGDAVMVQVKAPDAWPTNPPHMPGAEAVAKQRGVEELYTQTEILHGDRFLETTVQGSILKLWAEVTAIPMLLGAKPLTPDYDFPDMQAIRDMATGDEETQRKLRYCIKESATIAVETRAKHVLQGMPRQTLIDTVAATMHEQIEGKVNLRKPVPPLEAFTNINDVKASAYEDIYDNKILALTRRNAELRKAALEKEIADPEVTQRAEKEEALRQLQEVHIPQIDTALTERTIYGYDAETNNVFHQLDHPVYNWIEKQSTTHPEVVEIFIATDNNKNHTLDDILPVSLADAVGANPDYNPKRAEWMHEMEKRLDLFDGPAKYLILGEYDRLLRKFKTEKPEETAEDIMKTMASQTEELKKQTAEISKNKNRPRLRRGMRKPKGDNSK